MRATDMLTKAASLVGGDRNTEHGNINEGFQRTADLWSIYLGFNITPERVAMMLALLKLSRTTSGAKSDDNYVDMAGYAAIAGELKGTKEKAAPVKEQPELFDDGLFEEGIGGRATAWS